MAIEPAKIPSRRDRLVVSPERREEARAGMGGEQTKVAQPTAPAADVTPAPAAETLVAPAVAPTPDLTTAPTAEPAAGPVPVVSPAAGPKPAAAGAKRRVGRPAAAPDAMLMEPEHAVKIPESVWEEIRLSLVLFPKGEELPRNIKAYLVAAHRAYDAQLRKQAKLPAKQPADK